MAVNVRLFKVLRDNVLMQPLRIPSSFSPTPLFQLNLDSLPSEADVASAMASRIKVGVV